jgi:hypothetical protein
MDAPTKAGPIKAPASPQVSPPRSAPPIQRAPQVDLLGNRPNQPPEAFRSTLDSMAALPGRQAEAIRGLQRMRGNHFTGAVLQRKCACGACADCEKKREKENPIQRQAKGASPAAPQNMADSLAQSVGKPLPIGLRQQMESQFGHGFEAVQVFTDAHAAKAARDVNARAFTTGSRIYFAEGEYQPETAPGRELIAHELAHVVQQRSGAAGPAHKLAVDEPGNALEAEAERAATVVMQGRKPVVTGSGDGKIHRAAAKCSGPPVAGLVDLSEKLEVPGEKGEVANEYNAALNDCRLNTLGKFSRPGTDTLRNAWKRKSGVAFPETMLVDGDVCEVDHIIELQIGGTNNPENLQLLSKSNNASSGSQIKAQVAKLKGTYGEKLRFTKINVQSAVKDKCRDWETKKAKGGAGGNDIELIFGSRTLTIDLDKLKSLGTNQYDLSGRAGQIAAGIAFEVLTYSEGAKGNPAKGSQIRGKLTNGLKGFLKANQFIVDLDIGSDRKVTLAPAFKTLKAAFPYLSEADFNADISDEGFTGKGKFNPSLPLIKRSEVTIQVEKGVFSGGVKVSSGQVDIPIPGVVITESSLEAKLHESEFSASGVLAFKVGQYADAKLTAGADKSGFHAEGKVDFHIPGLDKALGKITYREKKLIGQVTIGKDKFKLPGIKSANLVVDITDSAITGQGEVQLSVPGVKQGTLTFSVDKTGNFSITGAAALSVPGLKEADINLTYAEGDLQGTAKIGLDVPGLQGAGAAFEVRYAKGIITGSGEFSYKKGKLTGKVHANLTEKHKLEGGGELAYEIFPGVVAGVGIEILENGKTKVSGEIKVPDAITLFDEKVYEKKIFSFGVQIPIFAIPLGTRSIGLVADIGADIKARAGIGPGQLRGVKAKATIDLSKDDNALEFQAAAELYVPASAALTLAVHGGLGLSLAIASATGGIELAASLGLAGALSTKVQISYQNGQFALDAVAEISAQPSLKFDISAYVKVEVDLFVTTIEVYRKDWKLASKEWGSGLKVGVRFPVHYETGKPFSVSLDQLEFIKPEIDIKQAVKDLLPM